MFPLENIAQFLKDKTGDSKLYAVISKWLCGFNFNYSIEDICSQGKNPYSTFSEAVANKGYMMVTILLYQMLFM